MFTRKLQMPQHGMPAAEEFALWGARELSFEELLSVNGGKREKKEKKSSGKSTSSGSSGGSSGSSHRRASSGTDSSTKDSSKSKEKKNKKPNTPSGSSAFDEKKSKPPVQSGTPSVNSSNAGESKKEEEKQGGSTDYTVQKGDTLSGIVRRQYPGASKEEIVRRVKEAAAHSGITDIDKIEPGQKILFEKPEPAAERANEGEKTSPTKGGGFPRGRWGRPSGSGGVSGSTGGSSGNSSGGESSGSGSSGGGNTNSGGSARFNGRRNRGGDWQGGKNPRMPPDWGTKEKQHTEGQEGGSGFAMRQEDAGQGAQDVRSKISGFFDRLWNKFGNVNKTNAESYLGKSRGGNWQSKEKFPVPPVSGASKLNWEQALEACKGFNLEGHNCDVYSTEVLEAGNKKPKDWPDPANTIVAETEKRKGANYLDYYKDNLVSSPQDGWNAMFMTDGTNDITVDAPHLAVAYQNNNGSISLTHYTANEIRTKHFDNLRLAETAFGYKKFQYLPLGQ